MGCFLSWCCPCIKPKPPQYEPVPVQSSYRTKIMVVGNISVGKSTLIKCLISGKRMRGVDVTRTHRFDLHDQQDRFSLPLPQKNAVLNIDFFDVAGENSANDLVRQFAPMTNLVIICYAINSR